MCSGTANDRRSPSNQGDRLSFIGGWPSNQTITLGEIEALFNQYDEKHGKWPESLYEGKEVMAFFKKKLGYNVPEEHDEQD